MRIIPVAAVMYVLAFVDRVNIAMILPYSNGDLRLTSGDIGFTVGIFFDRYMLLQIPGGLLASYVL